MPEIKVGDVVRYKLGGHPMLVEHRAATGYWVCGWLYGPKHDRKYRQEEFNPETLEPCEPDAELSSRGGA